VPLIPGADRVFLSLCVIMRTVAVRKRTQSVDFSDDHGWELIAGVLLICNFCMELYSFGFGWEESFFVHVHVD